MNHIIIRKGVEADFSTVITLIKELATFEKAPKSVTNTMDRMIKEKKYFECYVAEVNDEIVGFAIYFYAYYTWVGKSMYLDDIYVKPAYRKQNIGTKLLQKIVEKAKTEGCQRLRLQVLDWNTNAIAFYKKHSFNISKEWLNCTLSKKDMDMFFRN